MWTDFTPLLQSSPVQLETSDRNDREITELAIKAFELSHSLKQRWLTSDYNAKRTILSIMLDPARLNSENVEFSLRRPFDLLWDGKFVPLIGASGIPPIRSELSRQFPRAPAPAPLLGSSGACFDSQRGFILFSRIGFY